VRVRVADGPPQRIRDIGAQHMPGEEIWLIGERRANGECKYYLSNESEAGAPPPLLPLPPLGPLERRQFDYTDLTDSLAELDANIRSTRQSLDGMVRKWQGEP
jgi:hypothetical protein